MLNQSKSNLAYNDRFKEQFPHLSMEWKSSIYSMGIAALIKNKAERIFLLSCEEDGFSTSSDRELSDRTFGLLDESDIAKCLESLEQKGFLVALHDLHTSGEAHRRVYVNWDAIILALERKKNTPKANGVFYMLRLDSILKIGFSVNPVSRINSYRTGNQNVEQLFIGSKLISIADEKAFHRLHNFGKEQYSLDREQELLTALTAFDREDI